MKIIKVKTIKNEIIAIILILIVLTSCTKNDDNLPKIVLQKNVTQKIKDFKANLNLKVDNTISIDSAVWYLEGLLNYENANNEHNFENLFFYRDSISFDLSTETISYSKISDIYSCLSDKLNNIIESSNTSLFYDLIDVNIKQSNINSEYKTLTIVASIGTANEKFRWTANYVPFGSSESLVWGLEANNNDASTKLQYKINNAHKYTIFGYFTNIVEIQTTSGDFYDPNYTGSWEQAMIFCAQGEGEYPPNNIEPVLNSTELNYYLTKFEHIKNLLKPQGKIFKNINVLESCGLSNTEWMRCHVYDMYYGTYIY